MVLDAKTYVLGIVDELKERGELNLSDKDLQSRIDLLVDIFSPMNEETEKTLPTDDKIEKMIDKTIKNTKTNLTDEEKEKQREVLEDVFLKGKTMAEAIGIDEAAIDFMYREACRLFNNGQYDDAIGIYRFLDLFVPHPNFAFGAAASCHMQKNYKDAIAWYLKCIAMEREAPLPYYHLADCFLLTEDYLGAMVALEGLKKTAGKDEKYAKICKKAELMKKEAEKKYEAKQQGTK